MGTVWPAIGKRIGIIRLHSRECYEERRPKWRTSTKESLLDDGGGRGEKRGESQSQKAN